ncbi:GNAT family N-acetyltransferase [Xylophilus sp. GW821-FHT01B05]
MPAEATQPTLRSPRLLLRPYVLADAPEVQRLAGDFRVADTTANIPHPYPDGAAQSWIASHAADYQSRTRVSFAVVLAADAQLLGTVGLHDISAEHARAELGYWIAVDHWAQGYGTEATQCLMRYAQQELAITRIVARCLARNPASARVMEKAGLQREGLLRRHLLKRGQYEDMLLYGCNLAGR